MATINLWLLPRHNAYSHEAYSFESVNAEKVPKEGENIPLAYGEGDNKCPLSVKFVVREVSMREDGSADVFFYKK